MLFMHLHWCIVLDPLLRFIDVHFRIYGNDVSIGSNISLDSTYHLAVVRFTSKLMNFSIEVKPYVPDVQIVLSKFFLDNGWKHLKFQIGPSVSVL